VDDFAERVGQFGDRPWDGAPRGQALDPVGRPGGDQRTESGRRPRRFWWRPCISLARQVA
jgi:hypothetical protein